MLQVLDRFNHPVGIVTKSAGVLRDLDILTSMAKRRLARVYVSVTTLDPALARRMEPRAATPDRRLHAIAELTRAGVPAGVMVAPMIPGLNDAEMERIVEAAARAGARHAGYVLLRLPHELRQMFEDWLRDALPRPGQACAEPDPRNARRCAIRSALPPPFPDTAFMRTCCCAALPAPRAVGGLDEPRGSRLHALCGSRRAGRQLRTAAHFVLDRDRSGRTSRKGMPVTGVAYDTRYAPTLLDASGTLIGITWTPTPRLAADFRLEPHWWDAAPRPGAPPNPLPAEADVAIIGSGITGLNAALHLARGGRHVVVLDQGVPGIGASSRNAGYVGRTFKHSFGKLLRKRGPDFAITVYRELQAAFDAVAETVHSEQIECHFSICGRFIMAVSPAQSDSIAAEYELRRRHLGQPFEMVPRARQHTEIGSDAYHGGAVIPDLASIHLGLYHQGLLERAANAGAELHNTLTEVTRIFPRRPRFTLATCRRRAAGADMHGTLSSPPTAIQPSCRALGWPAGRSVDAFMVATETL